MTPIYLMAGVTVVCYEDQIQPELATIAARGEGPIDRGVRAGIRSTDTLFYVYTSGTTGMPKVTPCLPNLQPGAQTRSTLLRRPKSPTGGTSAPDVSSRCSTGFEGTTESTAPCPCTTAQGA